MLKTACIHPEIIKVLASCGHGDKVLITDGNYPVDSNVNEKTKVTYLNLTHGIPLVTEVLEVFIKTINIEKVEVMMPDSGEEPAIFGDFRAITGLELSSLRRFEFYNECKKNNIKLAVATGEQRTYANILLTVGVVQNKSISAEE